MRDPDGQYKLRLANLRKKDAEHQEWLVKIASAADRTVESLRSSDIEAHAATIPHPHSGKDK